MDIRNVAIIAHVDHGKTTLVDALLRQSHTRLSKEASGHDLSMDSNELERERGITIFSKNAAVEWNGTKINIIDTPGHADFGGEVERVLSLADGCLLLVDAKEGPMPQTRFVLKRALEKKLKIVVVVNKIDKKAARADFAIGKTFDLFLELGAGDMAADFPIVYASAKNAKAGLKNDLDSMTDISPVFESIMKEIPAPGGDDAKPLQVLIANIVGDSFKGRIATGRVVNGVIRMNQDVMHINRDGAMKKYRIVSLMTFMGLSRIDVQEAHAGDIIAISGIPDITIGETIADVNSPVALPLLDIEQPTIKMRFNVNSSPVAGTEGQFTTSRQIRERLMREAESDMALKVEDAPSDDTIGGWIVSGRGELHLSILIERLRREGYELEISRPQVITKEENGKTLSPHEYVYIEAPEEDSGSVIQKLGSRHGILQNMHTESGITLLEFIIPTRGLFGYRSEFLTDTKGLGIINAIFHAYAPDEGGWKEREQGSLVAHETGNSKLYGLVNIQDRGTLFYGPGVDVYKGQIVGQSSKSGDLRLNICKEKQLSNMRSRGEGVSVHFKTPKLMDLEDALEYIADDELVEVTPKNVRMRKIVLDKLDERRKQLGIT